eukprot:UN05739
MIVIIIVSDYLVNFVLNYFVFCKQNRILIEKGPKSIWITNAV